MKTFRQIDEVLDYLKDAGKITSGIYKSQLNHLQSGGGIFKEVRSFYEIDHPNDRYIINEDAENLDADMLENFDDLPDPIKKILEDHDTESEDLYGECKKTIQKLNAEGWTCDYDLSGELFDLKKKSPAGNQKVKYSHSWQTKSGVKNSQRESEIQDLPKFLNNVVNDAMMLQGINGGKLLIQLEKDRLYINYLDVNNTDKIDSAYMW